MEAVGMRALRENLAAYVARARAGERIVITDRGEEVAELVPMSPEVRALRRLVAEGRASWNGQRPALRASGVVNTGPSLSDAIVEDRDDSVL
jgi:prevent-host-death family protein